MAPQVKQEPKVAEFFHSVKLQECDKVKKMLKKREVDINIVDVNDMTRPTAIILASELGLLDMVKTLMRARPKPADINAETRLGKRAIWFAAIKPDADLAKQLLSDKSCDVNYMDKETGCTPLYRAVLSNCAAVVQELIHAGADVNLPRQGFGTRADTPLVTAVQMNNFEITELCINSMCKINAKTEEGLTALHYAVAYRRYDICELLLRNGAKVQVKSNHGVTPMTVAIQHHNPYMVRLLVEFGYKLDKSYSWGETPLEQAIKIHSSECALTLLHWGCSLKRKRGQRSYFRLAVEEKQWPVVSFLTHLHPIYLQERWLLGQKWPVGLYQRPDVRDHLMAARGQTWTLKQMCRARIFTLIGKYASVKLEKLPLPQMLKDYLRFNEFVKEDFYRQIPLEEAECPFDCPVRCQNRDCPELDISISSDSCSDFEI